MAHLKDSSRVVGDVEKILKTESELINAMKSPQKDAKTKDQLSEQLQEQNEQLEQDAQLLHGEASAQNFQQLDDKLDAQRLSEGLRQTADSMDRAALGVEHGDARRELRHGATQLHADALRLNAKDSLKVSTVLICAGCLFANSFFFLAGSEEARGGG